MIDVEKIFGKDYESFCEVDPYNPSNKVEGFISRKSNEYYGALVITRVNDKEVGDQLIFATPKLHYPFSSNNEGLRKYHFPTVNNVEIFEKLDGTNILAYSYKDSNGGDFFTFKTRLRPFLSSGRFGDFLAMWNEAAEKDFNEIFTLMALNDCNLSFELYGNRNTHLIVYDVPLAYALLFGVTNNGNVLSQYQLDCGKLSLAKTIGYFKNELQLPEYYERLQKDMDYGLKKVDEYYSGMEGVVWYLHSIDGRCTMWKCKPETIEAIHFAQGAGLGKNTILGTCWNALENTDNLTVEVVSQLLSEEFEVHIIECNKDLITECVEFVKHEVEFRSKVMEDYKAIGVNINLDKRTVMRALSVKYPKDKMGKVYSIIVGLG